MDILEEYLSWMRFTYFRMDGSTQLNDRRDMVDEYQRNDSIFIFLLSTRAGGLGVTLTGADTVIFYDNDWNPTMDAQATDRAHRIGQTKEVSVYRLITRHTVEENIVKRAKQKESVQSTVYSGGALRADTLKPHELVGFLVDEDNDEMNEPSSFIKTKKRPKTKNQNEQDQGVEPVSSEVFNVPKSDAPQVQHKIQYHYMSNSRHLEINKEDEEKSKQIIEKLKENQNASNDANIEIDDDFNNMIDDAELSFAVEAMLGKEEDNIQIDEDDE